MVVEIYKKLGHCINHYTASETETVQAMRAQQLAEKSSVLPVIPNSDKDIVLTYFWVDNFDHIVGNQAGGGAINTAHFKRKTAIVVLSQIYQQLNEQKEEQLTYQ